MGGYTYGANVWPFCIVQVRSLSPVPNLRSPRIQEDGCAVNAGVYMLDVREYATHKIQFHIAELISIHEKRLQNNMKGIWKRGVHQPSFVLALYNYTQARFPHPRHCELG
jgi:hypothetical protein